MLAACKQYPLKYNVPNGKENQRKESRVLEPMEAFQHAFWTGKFFLMYSWWNDYSSNPTFYSIDRWPSPTKKLPGQFFSPLETNSERATRKCRVKLTCCGQMLNCLTKASSYLLVSRAVSFSSLPMAEHCHILKAAIWILPKITPEVSLSIECLVSVFLIGIYSYDGHLNMFSV